MPNVYAAPAGTPIAELTARYLLAQLDASMRASAVILVPTRRACVTLREAFQRVLGEQTALLPRILPLADIDQVLLITLGADAVPLLADIPPAMPDWYQRYLLAAQIAAFLRRREGGAAVEDLLALADELMALEEKCARAGVTLTAESLRQLVVYDMAEHWEQSLIFLEILAAHWPRIEQATGMISAPAREVRLLHALAQHWQLNPPAFSVLAVGSTASQEATASLLGTIAAMPNGAVILPGLDPAIGPEEWATVASGHPLYHLKHLLDRLALAPGDVPLLPGVQSGRSVFLDALASSEAIAQWGAQPLGEYRHIKLIPCAHTEEEARVIALLLRETLETPGKRTALITPDEGLMARVAAHMKRYGITIDRLDHGTLALTAGGSLWLALVGVIVEPERLLPLRSLLHHPKLSIDAALLAAIEPYWYGATRRRSGSLPPLPADIRATDAYAKLEQWVRQLSRLIRPRLLPSQWIETLRELLAPWGAEHASEEAVEDALLQLAEADILGEIGVEEFQRLLEERLSVTARHGGVATYPGLFMLTPVEARLAQFDRVILAAMTDDLWPGIAAPNAWLNLAAEAALGLPPPTHHVSLMAHDLLMLAGAPELFFTWSARAEGSPTVRSRFIERLVTYLAIHGVPESAVTALEYVSWANALHSAPEFGPAMPVEPRPARAERPSRLPVSALDTLFRDPFSLYARHVLGLRALDALDAEPEASDFGTLVHKAIAELTAHWNENKRPASEEELAEISDKSILSFAERPAINLFWRERLLRGLIFVNQTEIQRRANSALAVTAELPLEGSIALDDRESLTLHGRIDRLERGGAGPTITDYKTGDAPGAKEILKGEATQLLAYAMLLGDEGGDAALEYWQLPRARHRGQISAPVHYGELVEAGVPQQLKAALLAMLQAETPFLATPSERDRDYDGISRYDEWAE